MKQTRKRDRGRGQRGRKDVLHRRAPSAGRWQSTANVSGSSLSLKKYTLLISLQPSAHITVGTTVSRSINLSWYLSTHGFGVVFLLNRIALFWRLDVALRPSGLLVPSECKAFSSLLLLTAMSSFSSGAITSKPDFSSAEPSEMLCSVGFMSWRICKVGIVGLLSAEFPYNEKTSRRTAEVV